MKKIALVTVYSKVNYGTVLQAYATQEVLDSLGYYNETINQCKINKIFRKKRIHYFVSHIFYKNLLSSKMGFLKKKILKAINYHELKKHEKERRKKFDEFINDNFRFTPAFENIDDLRMYVKDFSAAVAGSDQIWLPQHLEAGYYTLEWVPDNINRVSLSTSFGVKSIPHDMERKTARYLSKISELSVREDTGKEIVQRISHREAKVLCDPTLMIRSEIWEKVASDSHYKKNSYILCYFLGNNIEHRQFALKLKKQTGCKIVALIHMDEYFAFDEQYADETPFDVGPKEFLGLIKGARYICTDSYHATIFSVLFHKEFYVFSRFSDTNQMSTNSRIITLLNRLGLEKRLMNRRTKMVEESIDYEKVDRIVVELRKQAYEFIESALGPIEKPKCVKEFSKFNCCGCTACEAICPNKSISILYDREGFYYPKINEDTCIACGKCVLVCPVLNKKKVNVKKQYAYLAQNLNKEVRTSSTSGGIFTLIAEEIIKQNGCVYGAVYEKQTGNVRHICVENSNELCKFRGSKYVQSEITGIFEQIFYQLSNGRLVCFSGTPCQVEGLKKYLNRDYDNLLLVDVVCRGVPSPMIWKEYVCNKEQGLNEKIVDVSFRDKGKYGYRYSQMSISTSEKKIYLGGVDNNSYLRSFFGNVNVRPSCFNCRFRNRYREADLTLWDCLDIRNYTKQLDGEGTTRILIHSQKGLDIIMKCNDKMQMIMLDADMVVNDVKEMQCNKSVNRLRSDFFKEIENESKVNRVLSKYYPQNMKIRTEHLVRVCTVKMGIYAFIKKVYRKIRCN